MTDVEGRADAYRAEFYDALVRARAKGPNKALVSTLERIDREMPMTVRNQFKAWGQESCRLYMTDHGFRLRRLRAMGLHIAYDPRDHAALAEALKGQIHGDHLTRKAAKPWSRHSLATRWILIGYRLAELRMARAERRRRTFATVKTGD